MKIPQRALLLTSLSFALIASFALFLFSVRHRLWFIAHAVWNRDVTCGCSVAFLQTIGRSDFLLIGFACALVVFFFWFAFILGRIILRERRASRMLRNHTLCTRKLRGFSVDLLDMSGPIILCYGIVRPRVVLSEGAQHLLSDDELHAVLEHENAHARNFHPLQLFFLHVLERLFVLIPFFQSVVVHTRFLLEHQADRAAKNQYALKSALLRLSRVHGEQHAASLSPTFATLNVTEARIDALLGHTPRFSHWHLSASIGTMIVLFFFSIGGRVLGAPPSSHELRSLLLCEQRAAIIASVIPEDSAFFCSAVMSMEKIEGKIEKSERWEERFMSIPRR